MENTPLTANDLKPGHRIVIAGIEMMFLEFQNNHPVFYHEINGLVVNYTNKQYNRNTPLSELK